MNTLANRTTSIIDLGLIDYKEAWDYQTNLFDQILAVKSGNRTASVEIPTDNYLIFCEHPHVFTLGKTGDENNLLLTKDSLQSVQATYYHINRGGDITYHGPGQLVVYPVIDLENFFTDIHKYMRSLEEAVIQTLADFDITAGRIKGLTGVWLDVNDQSKARKICAFGVKTSRWVTLHGLALNVNTNLDYFNYIVPCGIQDKAVTSIQKELGHSVDLNLVKKRLTEKIVAIFDMSLVN